MELLFNRRRVLQTVTSLRVASISRARPPENLKYDPQQARFSLWKKLVPRESGGGNGA